MMTVNGAPVPATGTLLDACAAAGARVPAFCHGERLSAGAHCRACVVEANGHMVAACTTRAEEGLAVLTDTERLRDYRRDLGELMLAECSPEGRVGRTLEAWGADGTRYAKSIREDAIDRSHPYLRLDLDRCILCRQCVRACDEVQGQFVYAVEGRGAHARLTWAGGEFARSGCVGCGACVAACPTAAITDIDREPRTTAERTTRTTCGYCGVGCQLEVEVGEDEVVRVRGAEAAVNHGHLCVKGRYAHAFARHPERLTTPLMRRDGRMVPTSWEEAAARIASEFERLRGSLAGLSSSRCTNEENYLFQKWLRAGLGTNDVDCCARVCHAPSAAGMRAAFGLGAATHSFADVEQADCLLVVGANATESHPILGARMRRAALRGARLIVVDPRRTELAELADAHLRLRPGTNVPLLNALACVLVEEGLVDREFVARRVEGWDAYEPFIRTQTPERAELATGVPASRIRVAARLYGTARRPFMAHGLGVTEHFQGSEAVMLLCNLALLAGAIGRPGVGVNPLRGQNNVQGAADMGCQPDLLTGYQPVDDPDVRRVFAAVWKRPVPETPGRILPEMLEAARQGELRGMFVFGEDLLQTDPDSGRTREALERLEFLVVQEIFLTETARIAHVVLPGASALEKEGTFTNAERRVQRVRAALPPVGEARPDWEVLRMLMSATGYPQRFANPSEVMDEIARVAPLFAGVSYARLEPDGLQWPVPTPEHPGTPILHVRDFPRGRARLTPVEYVASPGLRDGLTLITGRVLEHYNNGSMTRRSPNLELVGRDALEIHPRDAAARGIADGDFVTVTSAHGEAHARARVTERVSPGVLFLSFHFPETGANTLTGDVRDRLSGCPEYKVTAVDVRRA